VQIDQMDGRPQAGYNPMLAERDVIRRMRRLLKLKDVDFSEWSDEDKDSLWRLKRGLDNAQRAGRKPDAEIIRRAQAGSMRMFHEIRRLGELLERYRREEQRRERTIEKRQANLLSRSHEKHDPSSAEIGDFDSKEKGSAADQTGRTHIQHPVSADVFPGPGWTGILADPDDPDAQAYWISPTGQWYGGTTTSLGEKLPLRPGTRGGLDPERLRKRLRKHEGYSETVYREPISGNLTIGIGHDLVTGTDAHVEAVGGNVERLKAGKDRLSPAQVEQLLELDIREKTAATRKIIPNYKELPGRAQEILVEMVFQMGPRGVSGFKNMIDALKVQDFRRAADEMLDSEWHRKQTPRRAKELSDLMRSLAEPSP